LSPCLPPATSSSIASAASAASAPLPPTTRAKPLPGQNALISALPPLPIAIPPAIPLPNAEILVIGQPQSDAKDLVERYSGELITEASPHVVQRVVKLGEQKVQVSLRLITSASQLNKSRFLNALGAVIVCSKNTDSALSQAKEWRREIDAACTVLGRPRLFSVLLALPTNNVDESTLVLFNKVVVKPANDAVNVDAVFAPIVAQYSTRSALQASARPAENALRTRTPSMGSILSTSSGSSKRGSDCVIS